MCGNLPKPFFQGEQEHLFHFFSPLPVLFPPCTFMQGALSLHCSAFFFVLPMSCHYSSPACFCSETTNHCLGSFCLGDKQTSVSYSGSQPPPATMSWRAHCLCLRLALVVYGSPKKTQKNKNKYKYTNGKFKIIINNKEVQQQQRGNLEVQCAGAWGRGGGCRGALSDAGSHLSPQPCNLIITSI